MVDMIYTIDRELFDVWLQIAECQPVQDPRAHARVSRKIECENKLHEKQHVKYDNNPFAVIFNYERKIEKLFKFQVARQMPNPMTAMASIPMEMANAAGQMANGAMKAFSGMAGGMGGGMGGGMPQVRRTLKKFIFMTIEKKWL